MKIRTAAVIIGAMSLAFISVAGVRPAFADKVVDNFKSKLDAADKAVKGAARASDKLKDAAQADLKARREEKGAVDRRRKAADEVIDAKKRLDGAKDDKARQRAQEELDKKWNDFRSANDAWDAADKKAKEKAKEWEKARGDQNGAYDAARDAMNEAEKTTPPKEPKGSAKDREMDRLKALKGNFKKVPPPISPPPPMPEPTVPTQSAEDTITIKKEKMEIEEVPPPPPEERTIETPSPATRGRDAFSIGIFLPFFPYCKLDQSKVAATCTGTGETIGTMANLTLTNKTAEMIAISLDPTVILPKKEGQFQPFCVTKAVNIILEPGETKTVPLTGVCLDPHIKPAGPDDKDTLKVVDPESPEIQEWKPLITGAQTIIDTTESLQKECAYKTPYSKDLCKERDMIVQWTTWLFVTTCKGKPITKTDLSKKVYEQTPPDITEEQKKKVDEGVDQIWECVKLTGIKAKLLEPETGEKTAIADRTGPGAGAMFKPAAGKEPKPEPADPKMRESMAKAGFVWDPVSGSYVSKKTAEEREKEAKKKAEEEEKKKYKRVTITSADGTAKEVIQCPDGTRLSEDNKDGYYIDSNGNKITYHDADLKIKEEEERQRKAEENKAKAEQGKTAAQAAYDAWNTREKDRNQRKSALVNEHRIASAERSKAIVDEINAINAERRADPMPPKPK